MNKMYNAIYKSIETDERTFYNDLSESLHDMYIMEQEARFNKLVSHLK